MIAVVYPQFYGVGGIARYLDSFLSNLPAGHPPVILITGDEHREVRSYLGVEIIHIPFTSSRFNLVIWGWKARTVIKQLHKEGKIKFVNFHFPPLIPGLFLSKKIPVVLTVHSTYLGMSGGFYPAKFYSSEIGWFTLKIKMVMESSIYRKSDKAITLTEFGRSQVNSYSYKKAISIIPNGVDLNQFKPSDNSNKDIDVIFTGRIERLKGSVGMIEVCRRLVEKKSDVLIYIVGYGEEEKWVKEQLADLSKNVIMTGKVPFAEMRRYYSRSYVYVSTSYYEGLPSTCLEAMALQLPTVVWDFLFYRGLVIEGQTGLLATPNDFAGMADKVLVLLGNKPLATQMGQNGRKLLEIEYNWSKLAADVLNVFKS